MISIRLARYGRKRAPFYRIIAVDSRKKPTGEFRENLGTWNPAKKELRIKKEEVRTLVSKGAQVSAAVNKLINK